MAGDKRYRPNVDYTVATQTTIDGHAAFTPDVNAVFSAPVGGLEVTGTVAAGASDSGNPIKVGGVYNSTKPTLTNGLRGDLQLGTRGSTIVQWALPDSAGAVTSQAAGADAVSNTFNAYFGAAMGYVFNGTTWDRAAGNTAGAFAQGNVASGVADSGNPVKIGGRYNTSLPTLTNGQRGDWQLTAKGAGIVTLYSAAGAEVSPLSSAEFLADLKSSTATPTNVSSQTAAITILASNAARKGGKIINTDANALYLVYQAAGAGTPSATNYYEVLATGDDHVIDAGYTGEIAGAWAADGAGKAMVWEIT